MDGCNTYGQNSTAVLDFYLFLYPFFYLPFPLSLSLSLSTYL